MRKLLFEALTSQPGFTGIVPANRWIQQGAMDEAPDRPFVVVGFSDRPRSDVGSARPRVTIWVHDDRGSYDRIDSLIELLEVELPNLVPLEDATHRIADIRFEGSSGDLTDDGYSTNTRNVNFSLTGRK